MLCVCQAWQGVCMAWKGKASEPRDWQLLIDEEESEQAAEMQAADKGDVVPSRLHPPEEM